MAHRLLTTVRGAVAVVSVALVALVTSTLGFVLDQTPIAAATTSQPLYYLAMGDSLAAGVGASTTGNRYVNVLYAHELSRFPSLQLENIACSGATTASVILGPGCSYSTGTQLGDAEAFLRSHPGQVPLVTIDIGGNDVIGCVSGSTVDATCVQSGLSQITSDLPQIVQGLEAAYPGVNIYGMNYYDPWLGDWLKGSSGQTLSQQSLSMVEQLNTLLAQLYAANKAAMADAATLFQINDFALTGTYLGVTEPQNVANVCNWTLFCPGGIDVHTNDIGHTLLATAFEQVVDILTITTSSLPDATRGTPYGPVTFQVAGVGFSTSPYVTKLKWKKISLPKGLKLSSTGVLSGTPSSKLAPGMYSVSVQATETVITLNGKKKVKTKTTVQAAIPLTIN